MEKNTQSEKDNLNNKKDIYFYVTDLKRFRKLIGFTDKEKIEKLEILIKVKNNKKKIRINNPIRVYDKWSVMEKYKITYPELNRLIAR